MQHKRKKIWIDRFQTFLFLRIALYFFLCQVTIWSVVLLERRLYEILLDLGSPIPFEVCLGFLVVTMLFLGFLFVYDAVQFAHRIVGPLYRFRKTIQAIKDGEDVELIRLRKKDYLQELKEDVNEMLRILEQRGAITVKTAEAKQEQRQATAV